MRNVFKNSVYGEIYWNVLSRRSTMVFPNHPSIEFLGGGIDNCTIACTVAKEISSTIKQ